MTLTRITLASRPVGVPTPENFGIDTGPVPQPGAGEVLIRTIYLSLDPYMRGRMDDAKSYAEPIPIGGTMEGEIVGEVVTSRHANYAAGDIVLGKCGWASHAVANGANLRKIDPAVAPISTAVGVLGMPGHTAFVGLNDIARAKAGETIVVSAATGAVGAVVCQLAKSMGLRVVGIAGGADKCAFAMRELGCDLCLDHRAAPDAATLSAQIAAAAPDGVDIYWEGVAGKVVEAVLPNMNNFGRIPLCGMIAWFSGKGATGAMAMPLAWRMILTKRLVVNGFVIFDHMDRLPAFLETVGPLVNSGEVSFRETMTDGLENAPRAFLDLLEGANFGKQIVKVGADPHQAT